MDIFKMDNAEIIRWILTMLVGGAGWAFALGRRIITNRVIEEASQIFVRREIYELEMRTIETSITTLQLEQKANHTDMVNRLDKAVGQINDKIELLTQ